MRAPLAPEVDLGPNAISNYGRELLGICSSKSQDYRHSPISCLPAIRPLKP